jgi:hypothetical protein
MQTIVVVCAQRFEVGVLVSGVTARPAINNLPKFREPSERQAELGENSGNHEEVTPPFWTWFIENPRGRTRK